MHLSWNEIRARAARFAEEWKDANYERGESQTFYNELFELFGVTRRRVRQIGGRLASRYRYSIGIVYNNFPWPDATDEQRARIRALAQAILDARAQFPTSTLLICTLLM